MKVHQTLEWLNLLSLGTKGLKPRQQSVCNQGSVTGGGWRGQHLNSQQNSLTTLSRHFVLSNARTLFSCRVYTILTVTREHCCQIPPGLLGQFSQKNSAAGEKIRPQAGHPRNHQKKCSKKIWLQIFGPIFANYC